MENPLTETQPGQPLDPAQLNLPAEIQNEPLTTASPLVEPALGQKILSAADKAFSAISSTIKKGRGRPRNDGAPKISDKIVPGEKSPSENPGKSPPVDSPPVNPAGILLFRRAVAAAIAGIFGILKQFIRIKADACGLEKEFTETALKQADPDKETVDGFNEALGLVMEKYKVQTEYAPEVALVIYGGRMAAPYLLLFKTFDAEIKRKRELERTESIKKAA